MYNFNLDSIRELALADFINNSAFYNANFIESSTLFNADEVESYRVFLYEMCSDEVLEFLLQHRNLIMLSLDIDERNIVFLDMLTRQEMTVTFHSVFR